MPTTYLKNELWNRIIRAGLEPVEFVNEAVSEKLERLKK